MGDLHYKTYHWVNRLRVCPPKSQYIKASESNIVSVYKQEIRVPGSKSMRLLKALLAQRLYKHKTNKYWQKRKCRMHEPVEVHTRPRKMKRAKGVVR